MISSLINSCAKVRLFSIHATDLCLKSDEWLKLKDEWSISLFVSGEELYHLTLSDCYLLDECKVGPREIDLVSSKDYELYTDCSLTRPSIYDSPDRERMMSSATDEEINDLKGYFPDDTIINE